MSFESYSIHRYSKNPKYDYRENKSVMGNLCKNCGYPYGEHAGIRCPGENGFIHEPRFGNIKMNKEFYPDSLNINIIIL